MDDPSAVWALSTFDSQSYAGHLGYADEAHALYRYDSLVQNSRQLAVGDLAVIRDETHVLGVARITDIDESSGVKQQRRCPQCQTTGIRQRKTVLPEFRCKRGHEFADPVETTARVTLYTASFDGTFVAANGTVGVWELLAAFAPGDQTSIRRLDIAKLPDSVMSKLTIPPPLDHPRARTR